MSYSSYEYSRALHGRNRRCGESDEELALPSPQCAATNFMRLRAPRRSVDNLPLLRDMAAFHLKRSPDDKVVAAPQLWKQLRPPAREIGSMEIGLLGLAAPLDDDRP